MGTPFTQIEDRFFGKITDDMYFSWTEEDTKRDVKNIFLDAVPGFEFPRFALEDFNENLDYNIDLTSEEINILAILMVRSWLQRQIASIENTRQKYSGTEFKLTSQANHLDKLLSLDELWEKKDRRAQRLYKRRKLNKNNIYESNWSTLMEKSTFDGD